MCGQVFKHALQVGWRRSGLGLWTPSGCRLVCSLRQARAQAGSQAQAQNSLYRGGAPLSLEVGRCCLSFLLFP